MAEPIHELPVESKPADSTMLNSTLLDSSLLSKLLDPSTSDSKVIEATLSDSSLVGKMLAPSPSDSKVNDATVNDSKLAERRAFPRRRPKGTGSYKTSSSPFARATAVKLTCISQGGLAFVGPAKDLKVGQHIELILQSPAAAVPLLTVKSEIRRIVPKENSNDSVVGCEFIDRLTYPQLIPFV